MAIYSKVSWSGEGLEDSNEGLDFGLYLYETEEEKELGIPIECFWFATEGERERFIIELEKE